jgi:1-deoxy-D-xylulose-5-phosphate reductoisomerase
MQRLSILGSTGSIGRNTLRIVEMFPERFSVKALTAKDNVELMADQVSRFHPDICAVAEEEGARRLKERLAPRLNTEVLYGEEGYRAAAVYGPVDTVVSAIVGAAGLFPTLEAISAGKDIALANKETLVMAGDIVMERVRQKGVHLRPVDSEHSAIFQCLSGNPGQAVKKIFLTGSGGPFLNLPESGFASITPEDALAHPTWEMGSKISIDSATLMNKGFEVIEAHHFFNLPYDMIEVIIHPQSIVHSMVAYRDGAVIAQLGLPDMRGAIAYALSCPERLPVNLPLPDFSAIGSLRFEKPDTARFPCLSLAYRACKAGGTLPAVLNAANEAAVCAFLEKRIRFSQIPELIRDVMDGHDPPAVANLEEIVKADQWARGMAAEWIDRKGVSLS